MGKLGFLLGSAVLGAAGLLAPLFMGKKALERDMSDAPDITPDAADKMDVFDVIRYLQDYSLASNRLSLRNSVFGLDCLHLNGGSLSAVNDTLLEKAKSRICDTLTTLSRKGKEQDLRFLRQRIEGLYQRYRPIFVRANRLLAAKGIMGVSLKDFTLAGQDFSLDNDAANENWGDDMTARRDILDDFITRTSSAAETLASRLKTLIGNTSVPVSITA